MRNKSAALRMSISTIILLVLAIALLGVLISSLLGALAPTTENMLDMLEAIDLDKKATYTENLVGADAFYLKGRGESLVAASFYNRDSHLCEEQTKLIFWCDTVVNSNTALGISVPKGEEKTVGGVIKLYSIPSGEYVCLVKIQCGLCTSVDNCEVVVQEHTIFKVD